VQVRCDLSVGGVGGQRNHAGAVQEVAEAFARVALAGVAGEQAVQRVQDGGLVDVLAIQRVEALAARVVANPAKALRLAKRLLREGPTDADGRVSNVATVTITLSMLKPSFFAVASMMRMLAWCGTSQSMSAPVMPLWASASWAHSPSTRTASLNTAWPSISR